MDLNKKINNEAAEGTESNSNTASETIKAERKSLKKSTVAAIIFAVIVLGIFSAQTYAYFTDTTPSIKNQIASGSLDVAIVGAQDEQLSGIAPSEFMPGTSVSRTVRIKNTGDLPVYVRIKIEKTINNSESNMPVGWEDLISCGFKLYDESAPNSENGDWIYRDGYYYYKSLLASESTTGALFDTISFSGDMGNEFTNSEIHVKVICHAVQTNGNTDDPLTAWGWPSDTVADQSMASKTTTNMITFNSDQDSPSDALN